MSFDQAEKQPDNPSGQVQKLVGEISASGLRSALDKILGSGIEVGILQVACPKKAGAIFIRAGAVKAAIAPSLQLQGIPALKQVLTATEGKYRFSTDTPREPIRETLNIDIGSLLSWRNPSDPEGLPSLTEALSVLSAANAYSSWGCSSEVTRAPSENPAANQTEAAHRSTADQFGLQEALARYEEQKKKEAELKGGAGSGNQSDSARQYSLEELKNIPTPSKGRGEQAISQRFNTEELKAIPTPNTGAPDRVTGGHRVTGAPSGSSGSPDAQIASGPHKNFPTEDGRKPMLTMEVAKPSKVRRSWHTFVSIGLPIALLGAAVLATNNMLQETNSTTQYNRGVKFLNDGYKELAKKSFDKVLEKDPKNTKALLQRAEARTQLNQLPAARRDYDMVLALDPKNIDAHSGRAAVYLKMRDFQHAVTAADEALRLNPDDTKSLLARATAYYALGIYPRTIDATTKIIKKKSAEGLAAAYALRGDAQLKRKNYSAARDDYSEAVMLAAKDRSHYGQRALALFHLKQYADAAADSTQAIFGDPTSSSLHMLRGESYEKLGQLYKALQDYDEAVGLKPGIDTYAARARVHLALKNYNRAAADFEEIVKDPKAPPSFKTQLASVQQKIKAMPVAQIDIEKLVGKPEVTRQLTYEEMVKYGQSLVEADKPTDAIKYLSTAIKANPRDAAPRRYLARAYAAAGQGTAAIEQFKHVESLDQQLDPHDQLAYAEALGSMKQYKEAAAMLNALVSQDPDFHDARVLLIQCLLRMNDTANALELCRVGASRATSPNDIKRFQQLYQVATTWQPH